MFTGLIEDLGKVTKIRTKSNNRIFSIQSAFTREVKISDSVAINGCCLTVIKVEKDNFLVEAISETLKTTNLLRLKVGEYVNLERARQIGERLEGHLVLGHIDEMAKISNIRKSPGSITLEIQVSKEGSINVIEKGSVAVDGISLTIAKIKGQKCTFNIIPYTFEHTNLKYKSIGDYVNIEYDVIGKYVRKYLGQRSSR